ncbi:TPA: hypothetical protein ACV5RJ_002661 [Enterobacter roggenkampii]
MIDVDVKRSYEAYIQNPEKRPQIDLREQIAQRQNALALADVRAREWPDYPYNQTGAPRYVSDPVIARVHQMIIEYKAERTKQKIREIEENKAIRENRTPRKKHASPEARKAADALVRKERYKKQMAIIDKLLSTEEGKLFLSG